MGHDVAEALDQVKTYLEEKFSEAFSVSRDPRDEFALYQSKSYTFKLTAAFLQVRTQEDYSVPVTDRLDAVLSGEAIEEGKKYLLTSRPVDEPIPIEYCVEEI